MYFKFLLSSILILTFSTQAHGQVKVDITAKEVDGIKGTIRIRDLVVNDSGRVYGGRMCVKNGVFYIGDNVVLADKPVDDWGIDLKIRILPNMKVEATTVLPNTLDKQRKIDSIESFLSSNLTPSIFDNGSVNCDERDKTDHTGTEVKYLEVKSINGLHSLRQVYEQLMEEVNK